MRILLLDHAQGSTQEVMQVLSGQGYGIGDAAAIRDLLVT
jgi:hypothetical protein